MKTFEYVERINLMHQLIKEQRTGRPEEFAKRLNLSKARLFQLIEELRLMGAPIAYSRFLETYYYTVAYKIEVSIHFKPLDDQELLNTNGGYAAFTKLHLFSSL